MHFLSFKPYHRCQCIHLVQLIYARAGYAPIDCFVQMKMHEACQQLNFTSRSKDIAFSMGFDDPYYFFKRFRTVIGIRPKSTGQWIRNYDAILKLYSLFENPG